MENICVVDLDAKEKIVKNIEVSTVNVMPEFEDVIWREQTEQFDDVCEGDTMEVAAEVELPACSTKIIETPNVTIEPLQSQSSEFVTSASLDISNLKLCPSDRVYNQALHSEYDGLNLDEITELPRKDNLPVSDEEIVFSKKSITGDPVSAKDHVKKESDSVDVLNNYELIYETPFPFGEMHRLPLKKRKAFSYNSHLKDKKFETSYPSTPMISIAELELVKEKCRFDSLKTNYLSLNNGRQTSSVSNYSTHPSYSSIPEANLDTVIMETDCKIIASAQNLKTEAFNKSFLTEHQEKQKIKFETPSQIKTFQHLSAAEDLLYFTHSSQTYIENQ